MSRVPSKELAKDIGATTRVAVFELVISGLYPSRHNNCK